jgi:hypothetical protein
LIWYAYIDSSNAPEFPVNISYLPSHLSTRWNHVDSWAAALFMHKQTGGRKDGVKHLYYDSRYLEHRGLILLHSSSPTVILEPYKNGRTHKAQLEKTKNVFLLHQRRSPSETP